eukprot:gene22939-9326_t
MIKAYRTSNEAEAEPDAPCSSGKGSISQHLVGNSKETMENIADAAAAERRKTRRGPVRDRNSDDDAPCSSKKRKEDWLTDEIPDDIMDDFPSPQIKRKIAPRPAPLIISDEEEERTRKRPVEE